MRRRGLAALTGVWMLAACGGSLAKLEREGRHEEVIARAANRDVPPRGRQARALARALQTVGRTEQALDVLAADVRSGGDLASLEALARLELATDRRLTAARHFEMLIELDAERVRGDAEACRSLAARVRGFLALEEGLAAEETLARIEEARCPEAVVARKTLAARADALADAQVDARVAASRPRTPASPESAAVLEAARREGPTRLRAAAARVGASLPAADVLAILLAELAQPDRWALSDDELRRLLGDLSWSDLAPLVMTRPEPAQAWLQLRLASVLSDLPLPAPGRDAGSWLGPALELAGPHAWRVLVWQGDLPAAEMELGSTLRPRVAAAGSEATASSTGVVAATSAAEQWSSRLPYVSEETPAILAVAHLRAEAGRRDLGLSLVLERLAQARAAADPRAAAWARDEALAYLGWGRPWHALAVVRGAGDPPALLAAVGTALRLQTVVCGGACREDADRSIVARVLGEDWVEAQREALEAREGEAGREGPCPSLEAALGEGSPLVAAIQEARAAGRLVAPEVLARALEAEPVLGCAATWSLPLVHPGAHRGVVDRLGDLLAVAPPSPSARENLVEARLALVAGDGARAELLGRRAAALSPDPEAVWLTLARTARAHGQRTLERWALRQAILEAPGNRAAERELLVGKLLASQQSYAEQETEAGRAALGRMVEAWLETLPAWERARARAELARRLAAHPGLRAAAGLVEPEASRAVRSPLDAAALAEAARAGELAEPGAVTRLLGDPQDLAPLRLALAQAARDWSVRRSMAVGLVAYGEAPDRARALASLREMVDGSSRARFDALVSAGLPSLAPTSEGAPRPTTAVPDPEVRMRLVLGLDLEPALMAR